MDVAIQTTFFVLCSRRWAQGFEENYLRELLVIISMREEGVESAVIAGDGRSPTLDEGASWDWNRQK